MPDFGGREFRAKRGRVRKPNVSDEDFRPIKPAGSFEDENEDFDIDYDVDYPPEDFTPETIARNIEDYGPDLDDENLDELLKEVTDRFLPGKIIDNQMIIHLKTPDGLRGVPVTTVEVQEDEFDVRYRFDSDSPWGSSWAEAIVLTSQTANPDIQNNIQDTQIRNMGEEEITIDDIPNSDSGHEDEL